MFCISIGFFSERGDLRTEKRITDVQEGLGVGASVTPVRKSLRDERMEEKRLKPCEENVSISSRSGLLTQSRFAPPPWIYAVGSDLQTQQ